MRSDKHFYPHLLTREQASLFCVDPKSFDKCIRSNDNLKRLVIDLFTIKLVFNYHISVIFL